MQKGRQPRLFDFYQQILISKCRRLQSKDNFAWYIYYWGRLLQSMIMAYYYLSQQQIINWLVGWFNQLTDIIIIIIYFRDNKNKVMYPRSSNKSTLHLIKDESFTSPQQDHQHLSKDIYYQHIKNKQLYNQIRQINPYFQYPLKNRIKNDNNDISITIREHSSLLEQYSYLINCQQKYRFQVQSINRQFQTPLSFFKHVWDKKQSNHYENSNQQRIDRLNKNIAFIKTNVSQLIKKYSYQNEQKGEEQNMIYQTKQYQILAQQYKKTRLQLEQLKQNYQQNIPKTNAITQDQSQQINKCRQQIIRLQQSNIKLSSLNKTMLSKINKLTQEIMQKDKQLNELKVNSGIIKRYQSQSLNNNNKPLFQVIIKQNKDDVLNISNQFSKVFSSKIINTKRSLDMIINFIQTEGFEQKLVNQFNIITGDQNLSIISLSDNSDLCKGKDLQDLMNQIDDKQNQRASFSDRKVGSKQYRKRQLVFNPRVVLGVNDDNRDMSKQFRFVRRK